MHLIEKLEKRFIVPLAAVTEAMEMSADYRNGKSTTVVIGRSLARNAAPFAAGAFGAAVVGGATVQAGEGGGTAPLAGGFAGFVGCEVLDCENVAADLAEQALTGRDPRN